MSVLIKCNQDIKSLQLSAIQNEILWGTFQTWHLPNVLHQHDTFFFNVPEKTRKTQHFCKQLRMEGISDYSLTKKTKNSLVILFKGHTDSWAVRIAIDAKVLVPLAGVYSIKQVLYFAR